MNENFTAEALKGTGSKIMAKVNEILICTKGLSDATNHISSYVMDGSTELGRIWGDISGTYNSIGNKINENVQALNGEIDKYIVRAAQFDREYEQSVNKFSQSMDEFEKQLANL